MRTPALALVAGLLLGLTACAGHQAAWQDFKVPNTDFAVSMPGEPKVTEDSTKKDGTVSRGYLVDQGRTAYMVQYSVLPPHKGRTPPPSPDQLLDAARDGLVPHMNGKLRGERRFTLGESRAAELTLDVPESKTEAAYVIKARIYVRRDAATHRAILYQSLVVGPAGYDAHPDVARFLDSFHFVTG